MLNLRQVLAEKGFRMTSQREAVLRTVEACEGEHLTVEEIYERTRVSAPDIGIATVYRTLQLLTDIGFLTRDYLGDNTVRYEINHEEEHHAHHHLVCLSCGAIIEAKDDLMNTIEDVLQTQYGFEIVDHRIQFLGHCSECRVKMAQEIADTGPASRENS